MVDLIFLFPIILTGLIGVLIFLFKFKELKFLEVLIEVSMVLALISWLLVFLILMRGIIL
jgi:hypothetical protein